MQSVSDVSKGIGERLPIRLIECRYDYACSVDSLGRIAQVPDNFRRLYPVHVPNPIIDSLEQIKNTLASL